MEDAGDMPDISPELALQLIAMRDSLIRTSLALHDWQCELDLEVQKLAQESTDEMLKRLGCHLGSTGSGTGS